MQKILSTQIKYLSLSEIREPKFLFRSSLGRIEELADSIRKKGLLNPLTVRRTAEGYELVCGWRRFNALKLIGATEALCVVHDGLDDRDAFEIALVENVQRQELSPIEEAKAFKKYVQEYGWGSATDLACKIGKDVSYVTRRMQFLELPEEVQRMLEEDFEARLARELEKRRRVERVPSDEPAEIPNSPEEGSDSLTNFASTQNSANLKSFATWQNLADLKPAGEPAEQEGFKPTSHQSPQPPTQQPAVSRPESRGLLTPRHAEELLKIRDRPDVVKEVAQAIREKGLTINETAFVVNSIYRGVDPKQALKAAEEALARKFDELNAKYNHIFDGLIPSRRSIAFRLAEEFVKGDFTEEEKRRIVELVNVVSLDDALWEIRKAREAARKTSEEALELAYARKEIEILRNRVAELEEAIRLREDMIVKCPFCGNSFPVNEGTQD